MHENEYLCVHQVLKINLIGHRKRILASLGDRLHEDTPQKPPRAISLRVSESLQADSMGFTHDNIEQYLNQLGFKLSWLYKTVVPFPDGSLFLWGKFSLPTAAVTTQMITQISQRGAKWPSHCRFLPADLSWMLLTMNWLSLSHHSHTPISRFFQAQRKPENLEAVLKQPAVPKHVFL